MTEKQQEKLDRIHSLLEHIETEIKSCRRLLRGDKVE